MGTFWNTLSEEIIKIAVYSTDRSFRKELKRLIEAVMPRIEITEYTLSEELMSDIRLVSKCPELLFLDIAQKEIADYISREKEKTGQSVMIGMPLVIIVAGDAFQVKDAAGAHAFAYLEKPVKIPSMAEVLKSAVREIRLCHRLDGRILPGKNENGFLAVRIGTQIRKISFSEILYVESMSRKVIVKLADEEVVYYDKISKLELTLGEGFYRIHRGYLVALSHVVRFYRTEVEMANGEKLPLSKYRYAGFAEAFEKYIQQ